MNDGWDFAPNFKASYDLVRWKGKGGYPKVLAGGLEYYASFGQLNEMQPFSDQQQQFFPAIDLDVSPNWEFNFGVGIGATQATDHLIVKAIVGRRFDSGRGKTQKRSRDTIVVEEIGRREYGIAPGIADFGRSGAG